MEGKTQITVFRVKHNNNASLKAGTIQGNTQEETTTCLIPLRGEQLQ